MFFLAAGKASGQQENELPPGSKQIHAPIAASPRIQCAGGGYFEQNYLTIMAGGDIMIGHWTLEYLASEGADYPFRNLGSTLRQGGIIFGNLEAPLADSGQVAEKQFTFKVPTRYASGLREAGFNVLSLANNHIMDFGETGLIQTRRALDTAGIKYAGAGLNRSEAWQPAIIETAAGRVGVLAFSMTFPEEFWATAAKPGTAYPTEQAMAACLDTLRPRVDFLIASFHWGTEKKTTPNDYQTYFAHLAIDHGADLVLGHHPHVLQGLELYKNRLIAYSLGNLAFSSYSSVALHSMLLKVVLHREGLLFAKILPLNVDNSRVEFQPALADSQLARAIIDELDKLSLPLNRRDIIESSGYILGEFPGLRISAHGPASVRGAMPQ